MGKKSTPAIDPGRSDRIGEQQETITVELTESEVELERAKVMDLLHRRTNLEQSRASIQAEYKAKIKLVDRDINEACQAATTRRRAVTVVVEDWLRGSQVFRIRADTGEVLGQRAATAGERQESMFPDPPKAADRFAADAFGDAT